MPKRGSQFPAVVIHTEFRRPFRIGKVKLQIQLGSRDELPRDRRRQRFAMIDESPLSHWLIIHAEIETLARMPLGDQERAEIEQDETVLQVIKEILETD